MDTLNDGYDSSIIVAEGVPSSKNSEIKDDPKYSISKSLREDTSPPVSERNIDAEQNIITIPSLDNYGC